MPKRDAPQAPEEPPVPEEPQVPQVPQIQGQLFRDFGKIAGLAGLVVGVLLVLFSQVIQRNIFSSMSPDHSFRIVLALMILTFGIAGIGIIAWLIGKAVDPQRAVPPSSPYILAALVALVVLAAVYTGAGAQPPITPTATSTPTPTPQKLEPAPGAASTATTPSSVSTAQAPGATSTSAPTPASSPPASASPTPAQAAPASPPASTPATQALAQEAKAAPKGPFKFCFGIIGLDADYCKDAHGKYDCDAKNGFTKKHWDDLAIAFCGTNPPQYDTARTRYLGGGSCGMSAYVLACKL